MEENKKVYKQREAVAAYKALERISELPMEWDTIYKLFELKKALKGQADFQQECEKKLLEKYQPERKNNQLKLKTTEEARAFDQEWINIGNIDLPNLEIPEVIIPVRELTEAGEQAQMKGIIRDLEALDVFVMFEKDDTEEIPVLEIAAPEE